MWMVVVSAQQGQPTLKQQAEARQSELERGVQSDPLVQSVLARFPGAQIVAVRQQREEAAPLYAAADPDAETPDDTMDESAYGLDGRPDYDDDVF
jgi:DNA polymerase-3 subunit gamma/tau